MPLGLHVASHDAEGEPGLASARDEAGDDRVEGPLARLERIRMVGVEREEPATVLEREAQLRDDVARSEAGVVALDPGHEHPLVVPDRHGRPTGFRVPSLPLARAFLEAADCRVIATSANLTDTPAAVTAQEVLDDFDGLVDAVIDAGRSYHEKSSTVVRVLGGEVELLREGAIPESEILEAAARVLLFVCSGNRCRSPLAAALGERLLAKRLGIRPDELVANGYRIESAGTACINGTRSSPEVEAVAGDYGCDLTFHRSRPLTPSLVEEADEIWVMTGAHRDSILQFSPEAAERIRLLDKQYEDIEDPYDLGTEAYRETARRIHRALQSRLDDF